MSQYEPYGKDRQKHDISSTFGYLIGVRKFIFENENEPLLLGKYNELEQEKSARIIRNLCIMRADLAKWYKKINDQMTYEHKPTSNIYEFPTEAMEQLSRDGIQLFNTKSYPSDYIIVINQQLSNRLETVRKFFPEWVEWPYIRKLFLMPGKNDKPSNSLEIKKYYESKAFYPYSQYINWEPTESGNIIANDFKFINLVYTLNNDTFEDYSKLSDAGERVKADITGFISGAKKCVFVVDCENADPYKFIATINNMPDWQKERITKIILCDDVNASSAWQLLKNHITIPVEYILAERIRDHKSLVDIRLTAEASREHYQNGVDSFVLVSSDSDYFVLIDVMRDAKFLFMLEHEKTSRELKDKLRENDALYCYTDDFYTGDSDELKQVTVLKEVKKEVDAAFDLNITKILNLAVQRARANFTDAETKAFVRKYIKPMHLDIADDGKVKIIFGKA